MASTKMEADYSDTANRQIAKAKEQVAAGKLSDAVDGLLAVEKQARLANDLDSVKKIAVEILDLSMAAKDWKALINNVTVLAKRRSQFKQVVTAVVDRGVEFLPKAASEADKLALVEALRTVSEGKIYVEVQRARLTKMLAEAREAAGKVTEAAEILQEVQVETYGAMEPREKTEFILEQLRLTLARRDLIRTSIISKKIVPKVINAPEYADLKLRFHRLMIEFRSLGSEWLEMSRSYQAIYDTPSVKESASEAASALFSAVIYALLAPYNNEQVDAINRLGGDKGLESQPQVKEMVSAFTTAEVIDWKAFGTSFGPTLKTHPEFSGKDSAARMKTLHSRVIEHNIRIVAKYYSQMTVKRLAEILSLDVAEAEKGLAEQVSEGNVWARIDRPAGVITFVKRQEPNDVLNEWNGNVTRLLELIESTTHLINRENMVYKIK